MSDNSRIEWTETTWNVITGCTKVSAGCDHCYIERTPPFRMAGRSFDKPGVGGTTGVTLHPERLRNPMRWRKPRRVFVNSLADLFHDGVPVAFIGEAFATMALAEQHTFQILTKRHSRMRTWLSDPTFHEFVQRCAVPLAKEWGLNTTWAERVTDPSSWPLPNVWLGVSVESQQWADIRIPALLETPAAVRWISAEPLLGPVDLLPFVSHQCDCPGPGHNRLSEFGPRVDWVVAGGESGPGSRPMHPDWARGLRDRCTEAGVPFFFKQWGEWCWTEQMPQDTWRGLDAAINLAQAHPDPHRVGKKRAGRLLDGRAWDEYPAGAR